MTKALLLLAFLSIGLFSEFIYQYQVTDAIFVFFGLAAYWVNRHYPHIVGLLLIIIGVRFLEIVFWWCVETNSALLIYPVQIACDATVLVLLHYRWHILATVKKNIRVNEIVFTHADYYLSLIYLCYGSVTFLALVEHIIWAPDTIGLPAEWGISNLSIMYNSIDYIKFFLSVLQYSVILFSAHHYLSSERIIRA